MNVLILSLIFVPTYDTLDFEMFDTTRCAVSDTIRMLYLLPYQRIEITMESEGIETREEIDCMLEPRQTFWQKIKTFFQRLWEWLTTPI